jgi:hypothetical protein
MSIKLTETQEGYLKEIEKSKQPEGLRNHRVGTARAYYLDINKRRVNSIDRKLEILNALPFMDEEQQKFYFTERRKCIDTRIHELEIEVDKLELEKQLIDHEIGFIWLSSSITDRESRINDVDYVKKVLSEQRAEMIE